jgi:hypothetical protein
MDLVCDERLSDAPFVERIWHSHGEQRTLEGQPHDVNLEVLAPVLMEFSNS